MCTKSDLQIPTGYEYWEDYCAECERKAADRLFIEMVQSNIKPKDVLKVPKGTGYVEVFEQGLRVIYGNRLYELVENCGAEGCLVMREVE